MLVTIVLSGVSQCNINCIIITVTYKLLYMMIMIIIIIIIIIKKIR
jgi:hypothetical protein